MTTNTRGSTAQTRTARYMVTVEERCVYEVEATSSESAERIVMESEPATLTRAGGPNDGEITFVQAVRSEQARAAIKAAEGE